MIQNNNNNFSGFAGLQQPKNDQQNLYQRLMEMRTTPYNSYRTVFNDISDE